MNKYLKKTVFVIGAGFSSGLNAPLQSEIIKEIFELDIAKLSGEEKTIYQENIDIFRLFLQNTFYISPSNFQDLSLEDIYTPIDRCILDNSSFRNYTRTDLIDLRQRINALIVILFASKLQTPLSTSYAKKFAKYLVQFRKIHKNNDPFSVISLNWDIILDDALYSEIEKEEGVLDYCCYITPYEPLENIIPGLLARGMGLYNLKLLKLHGSMNWLQCPGCQRLYVAFNKKIVLDEFLTRPHCRLCAKNFRKEHDGPLLISQLIMPTFLKDFNNPQLKLIWQNAGIEISEASHLVFLGYSFPAADFELRQLFARFTRQDAKISVILKDKPDKNEKDYPELRYRSFFGKRNIRVTYKGVENFINFICN